MSSPLTIAEQAIAHGRGLKAELEAYVQLGRTVTIKVYGGAGGSSLRVHWMLNEAGQSYETVKNHSRTFL